MIELICVIRSTFIIRNWLTIIFGFTLSVILGLVKINQRFSISIDTFFVFSSISNLLIFLTCLLCFLSLISTPEEKSFFYSMCLSSLCLVLVLAFSASNLFIFYVFFEASLIPTLILIIGWGYQPERLQAGTYIILYTVGASLPLLLVLLWHCSRIRTINTYILYLVSSSLRGIMRLIIYGAFLVKLPIYGAHLWLPKAHVEAPLAGSIILAGILLKLGGYGIIQINFCFNLKIDIYITAIIVVRIWGGFLATLICLRQVDVKSLVAYSSVGHIRIVAAGILIDRRWGVIRAVITMIAHGFSSSAMFCLAYFSYKKSHTRNIPYIKGMLQVYPILRLIWFIFCCINIACPPTLNLIGEMAIIPVLWNYNFLLALIMGLIVFFRARYNIYLYSAVNHGSFSSYFLGGFPIKRYSKVGLFAHIIPLALIFKSTLFNIFFNLL